MKPSSESKEKRFKDEYFCAMQIPTHQNLAQSYHFDFVSLNESQYYIIIMEYYPSTLSNMGSIVEESDEIKNEKGWKLFLDLVRAVKHLNDHHIIHRDIKPQNIFYSNNKFVLGDLGIAHFDEENFAKESKTKPSERLANYSFSAPEQVDSKTKITEASDIYSIGQVIQWYLTGSSIRGLGRKRFSSSEPLKNLNNLDQIVEVCLRDDPKSRFQSINDIKEFNDKLNAVPERNIWKKMYDIDEAIRCSFPKIRNYYHATESKEIERFIKNFNSICKAEEFWYMNLDGGDNTYQPLIKLEGENKWLFCGQEELTIEQLIVYKDSHFLYKNFFVILVSPEKPFDIVDNNGCHIERNVDINYRDHAVLWGDKYIEPTEVENGYFDNGSEIIETDPELFSYRLRHLKKYAYIVVPQGTATSIMTDRSPTEEFLASVVKHSKMTDSALKDYKDKTRNHHSTEITKYD
ncbi:hypothetical protein BZJ17_14170 [Salinivibrio sp. IB574]|nr:hypothetical protein BZJ17_14170 [Salinivibrio sp. IB574]